MAEARIKRGVVAALLAAGLGTIALPVAVAPAVLASAGCAGDDCDSDTQTWGSCTQGERIDATHWESGPIIGKPWLNDHGERTWIFDPTPWMGSGTPSAVDIELAFDPYPFADAAGGAAPAAGNLGEWTLLPTAKGYKVQVLNDSCAQYYLRVVVTYYPGSESAITGTCGGADAAAGGTDSGI